MIANNYEIQSLSHFVESDDLFPTKNVVESDAGYIGLRA